ncbi:MAG: DUF502 domain-containing protein [Woeseia sp.]|nr:DUF502 domain-containing protein [Woeseia sp.]MBT8096043.1 DUF502 domain-containing protein [Woeseia sp.]NNE59388.1 DUF502 domain-containing protein [Woeseia sp.]NNL54462.1 DUF502 domain-containing protein [Woeseia sp.]
MKGFRRYFVAGLLVWLPLAVTFLLLRFVIGLMDNTLSLLPEQYRPETLLGYDIPGFGLVLSVLVIFATGVLAANIVGRGMVGLWESVLQRIPIVRSIYTASKNFAEVVFSDSGQSFKKVLLIEYPRKGVYSLAFQTATSLGEVQERTGDDVICCFVPTTPNPTSGYIIAIAKDEVIELDMTVDQALKMIISLGVVVPTWPTDQVEELTAEVPPKSSRENAPKD